MAVNINGGPLEFSAIVTAQQFNLAISQIEKQLQGLTKTAEKEANAIENITKKAASAIAAYATFTTASNFVQDIVRVRGEFQQLEVAFSTMLGSKEKADKLMAGVTNFAATTPFELTEVASATKQLLAFGISADDIIPTLRSLGDVSAGIGAPIGEIAYLFGTIKTQGKAMTVDIRQFAQRGIPIYEELAKILKVDKTQLDSFIEAGKVGFPEIQKVFQNLTAEGSKFGGLMEAQSKTLTGQISNLKDAWDQMLNTIGKGQEGLFSDAIGSATYLVQHFREVLKALQILIVTYGAYRAAVIATSISTAVYDVASKRLLITQTLQNTATAIGTRAMALLNKTMLANPAVAVITGIAALTTALIVLSDNTTAQAKAQEQLNDENEKYKNSIDELKSKTASLVSVTKDESETKLSQVTAFRQLKQMYPEALKNIDLMVFKTMSAQQIQRDFNKEIEKNSIQKLADDYKNAGKQIEVLTQLLATMPPTFPGTFGVGASEVSKDLEVAKEKARILADEIKRAKDAEWEANTPLEKRINFYIAQQKLLEKQRDTLKDSLDQMKKMGVAAYDFRYSLENTKLDNVIQQLNDVNTKLNLSTATPQVDKNKAYYETIKKNAIESINALKTTDADFNIKKAEQVRIINQADEALKRFDYSTRKNTEATKAANKENTEYNRLMEQRKSLLENVESVKRDAKQSGLVKEQSELDKINEKYDLLINNVTQYNKKVDEFNRKSRTKDAQKLGQLDINAIIDARSKELNNSRLKQQAEDYKKYLENQKEIFASYEQAKNEVGIAKAKELFASQIGQYQNYLQLLNDRAKKLAPLVGFGLANVGQEIEFKATIDSIQQYNREKEKEALESAKKHFIDLLHAAITYNDEKLAINEKYDKLEAALIADTTLSDTELRKKILAQGREEELQALENNLIRQSALYKKLNQDIIGFSRARLKEEIKLLKESLKTDKTLTPEVKAALQSTISQYQGLLNETNQVRIAFEQVSSDLGTVSSSFGTLANSVSSLNKELGDTLQNISDIASAGADAAKSISAFATGDLSSGITSAVSAIAKIVEGFAKAKQSKLEALQNISDFQLAIYQGEVQYQELIMQRMRAEVKSNKLRLEGLNAEKKMLQEQRDIVLKNYQDIFAKLQNESFISGQTTKKRSGGALTGLLGFFSGTRTVVQNELTSLAGKTYDEIEKLFLGGQLTENAKKLFEQLRAIKQEGVDIDSLLADNARAIQEAFTGTTAGGITDSIAEGFANGLRTANDFAGKFEDFMRTAIINSFKFKYLEPAFADFYKQFADASQSGGQLTTDEINQLRAAFKNILADADQQFQQLQQIAGINFNTTGANGASNLTGAIKGITEQQAELLAGQFGGLRMTALEALSVSRGQLSALNAIQSNTAAQVSKMVELLSKYDQYETGAKLVHVKVH